MQAFEINDYGAVPALVERPIPSPGEGEILVKIAAAGLNFADLLMIKGRYQERPDPPVTLGMELAGVVEAAGPDAGFAPGRRVAVYSGQGALAEYGVFPADRAVALPDEIPFDAAAGFLIAHGTSHIALTRRARLKAGETLLVLGAAGGVGLTAVEIGAMLGARVIACARGAEKLEIARRAGASHLIDSETADIREDVKALGGADVVYDPVGGDQFTAAFRATNPEGRILTIGFASGDVPPIPANHLLVKNIDIIGLNWGGYLRFNPQAITETIEAIFAGYAAGKLAVHISHRFPLEKAAEALEVIRTRKATGKVIVEMGN